VAISSQLTSLLAQDVVYDLEYYILESQNGEKWAQDDKSIDKKLADFRKENWPGVVWPLVPLRNIPVVRKCRKA